MPLDRSAEHRICGMLTRIFFANFITLLFSLAAELSSGTLSRPGTREPLKESRHPTVVAERFRSERVGSVPVVNIEASPVKWRLRKLRTAGFGGQGARQSKIPHQVDQGFFREAETRLAERKGECRLLKFEFLTKPLKAQRHILLKKLPRPRKSACVCVCARAQSTCWLPSRGTASPSTAGTRPWAPDCDAPTPKHRMGMVRAGLKTRC